MSFKESIELIALSKKEELSEDEESRLEYLQDEYKSVKIKDFIKLFINPFLPAVKDIGNYTMGGTRTLHKHANLSSFSLNSYFNNSIYQFRLKKNQRLIHYTSLSSLMSIIREGKIRLYSMNHKVDPGEVIHTSRIMGYKDSLLKQIRTELFCISFALLDENTSEVFDHWRLYGHDGEGVGIVFSFDLEDIENWFQFHISKIHYDTHENNPFNKKQAEIDEWQIREEFQIRETHNLFSKLFAFHKSSIFSSENEVRLLKYEKHNHLQEGININSKKNSVYLDINKFGQESYFIELELGKVYELKYEGKEGFFKDYHKSIPKLKIEKIILGYGSSWEKGSIKRMETIHKQAQLTLGYTFEIDRSMFMNHFE